MPSLPIIETQSLVPNADVAGGTGLPGLDEAQGAFGRVVSSVGAVVQQHQRELGMVQATEAANRIALKLQKMRDDADAVVPQALQEINDSDDPIGNIDKYTDAQANRAQMLSPEGMSSAIDNMAAVEARGINGAGQSLFRQRVAELRGQTMLQAQQQQHLERQQVLSTSIDGATDTSVHVVANDHNQWPIQLAQISAMIEATTLPPALKAEKLRYAQNSLSTAATEGLLARYPAATLAGLNRYFGVSEPPPASAPAPMPQSGAASAATGRGSGDLAEAQAAADAARSSPDRIPTLQAEISNPVTTAASRAALQSEIDGIRQRAAPSPESRLTTADAVRSLEARGGNAGDAGLPFLNALAPQQALEFRNRALEAVQRGQAQQRVLLEARAKDFQSMVLSGVAPPAGSVPTLDDYAQAFGVSASQRYESDVGTYARLADGLTQLQGASYQDRQAIIARYAPVPGSGFDEQQRMQATLVQANALIEKKIATDPAAYAAQNSPLVQQAASSMQATLSDVTSTPAQRAAAVDNFSTVTTAEQQRLGISSIRSDVLGEGGAPRQLAPRLLTNGQANALAEQFHSNPANAAQLMDGLQATWGSHFPQVYAQLAQDEKLPPAALVIPNMSDPFAKEALARLSDPKVQKELEDGLPAGSKKDIDARLQQLNEPFYNSLAYQQGGQGTYSLVTGQQAALAASYVMQGRSASDAARIAFEQTVGHQYQFADTLRIPKAEQPDMVLAGAAAVATNPAALQTAVPQSFRSGLTDKDRQAAWFDAMKSGPTWVANADESGATLYVRGRSDAGGDALFAVRGPGGKTPLTWTWAQLRAIAANRPKPGPVDTTFGAPIPAGAPYTRGEAFVPKLSDADRAAGLR